MSDGARDATRSANMLANVESAAIELKRAFEDTGDIIFWKVNPAAVRCANYILKDIELSLEKL